VAINDVLPPKAVWRDAIANLNALEPRDTTEFRRFHLHSLCGATLFAGIVIIASVDGRWVKIPVLLFRHLAQFCRVKNHPKISSLQLLDISARELFKNLNVRLQIWLTTQHIITLDW